MPDSDGQRRRADAQAPRKRYIRRMGSLYDTDLYLWTIEQADALREMARAGSNARVDWENVAEEIESLGKSDRRGVQSQLRRILVHLMKLQASPATDPRPGWRETVSEARDEIEVLLRDSPSLTRQVATLIEQQSPLARNLVARSLADYGEEPRVPIEGLAYTEDQVLGDWLP